jgi:hypothetical protein
MPPVSVVLVQIMGGIFEHPIGHEPSDAELDAIRDRYVAEGVDVISVRAVESPRIPPYQNAYEPLPEDGWGRR